MLKFIAILAILLAAVASFMTNKEFYNTGIPLWIWLVETAITTFLSWPKQSRNKSRSPHSSYAN